MKRIVSDILARQFISYFGVGGVSALVEWVVFFLMEYLFDIPYLLATIIAFIFSTLTNWFLGRKFTFRDKKYRKKGEEIFLVFLVSAIGLLFNMFLMTLFVNYIGMKSNLMKTFAKIISTGIVFIWNFLSRKFWVYKENDEI